MKIIKILVALFGLFSILGGILLFIVRTPSYDIQTNGKLYIVNKLSKSITVFDLFEGNTIIEFPMDIEPHEATTLHVRVASTSDQRVRLLLWALRE